MLLTAVFPLKQNTLVVHLLFLQVYLIFAAVMDTQTSFDKNVPPPSSQMWAMSFAWQRIKKNTVARAPGGEQVVMDFETLDKGITYMYM